MKEKIEKKELTLQQKKVIANSAGVKRVIACAGSGKTFVLTQSIIELLEKQVCRPDEVLAITFTRNAAENMRRSIKENLSRDIDFEAINIYTFNSFGNLIVSENSFALGLGKDYKLINTSKSWQILFDVMKYASLENIVVGKDTARFIEQVLRYIGNLKSNLISAEELKQYYDNRDTVLSSYSSRALKREEEDIFGYLKDIISIYQRYEEIKNQNNFIDYNDHVFLPYRLLLDKRSLLGKYRNRYKYIYIDEFQDTDIAQGRLISLLFKPGHNSLMIVGDDDQAIYSFRGACVENILGFANWDVFSGVDVQDFYLTTNFRSGRNIIRTIDNVISKNESRFVKDLKPHDKTRKSEVLFFSEETHTAECEEIAAKIKSLQKQGFRLKDMAILSRIKRFEVICDELDKNGLKYELVSGRGFFYEPEILFLISWLMILEDIDDEVYLVYLLQSDKYRISDRDIFFLTYSTKGKNRGGLVDGLMDYKGNVYLDDSTKARIGEFIDELDYYIKQSSYLKLAELIALIFKHSGLYEELKSDFDPAARIRIRNVETMIKISSDFESESLDNDLDSFVIYLKNIARTEEEDPDTIRFSRSNSIKIMSIHAAKGLEFKVVFLPMLWKTDYKGRPVSSRFKIPSLLRKDRGIYNKKDSFTSRKGFYDELRKLNIEEERRIFYVACSRAKNLLFLSYSRFKRTEELKKPDKKAKDVLPFLLDIFNGGGIKALNKKSLDFIESVSGRTSNTGLSEESRYINKKNTAARGSSREDDVQDSSPVFDTEQAHKAEDSLVFLIGKYGKKEMQKRYGNYIAGAQKPPEAVDHRPKTHFSLTELLDYIYCPVHYKWKYFYNIPEGTSERTGIGEMVHDRILAVTVMRFRSFLDDGSIASRDSNNAGVHTGHKDREDHISRYVDNYKKSRFYSYNDLKHMFLEQLFYWNLSSCIITCKLDRMDMTEDGHIRVVDYKISELKKKNPDKNYVRQLKAYTAGISEVFGVSMDKITGHLLYLGNKMEHEMSFSNLQIKEFSNELKEVMESINILDFTIREKNCRQESCSYYPMCTRSSIRL